MMVSFGSASGPVPEFSLNELAARGSLFITRPSLMSYTAKRTDLEQMAAQLFAMLESGKIKVDIRQTYPLSQVVQAHRELEARKTTGSSILIP
jgi:NADPH2:quinone reductase